MFTTVLSEMFFDFPDHFMMIGSIMIVAGLLLQTIHYVQYQLSGALLLFLGSTIYLTYDFAWQMLGGIFLASCICMFAIALAVRALSTHHVIKEKERMSISEEDAWES